uniref:Uncharacterized protein n=1 Tax=Rhizophora mucronata TaxID=61149 RepID=A0A2P2JUK8_RHIMU
MSCWVCFFARTCYLSALLDICVKPNNWLMVL